MKMASAEDDYEWQPPTEAEMKILQAKRERSNRISKLMGDYLLKGYKMLGTSCQECGTIYLQDKQKKNYCVSCNELSSDTIKDDPALNQEAARRQVAEEQQRHPAVLRDSSPEPDPTPLPPQAPAAAPGSITVNGFNGNPEPTGGGSRRPQMSRPPKRSISDCSQPLGQGPGMVPSYSNPSMHGSVSSPAVGVQSPPGMADHLRGSMSSLSTLTGRHDMTEPLAVVSAKLNWATAELARCGGVEGSIQLCQLVKVCADALTALHNVHGKEA